MYNLFLNILIIVDQICLKKGRFVLLTLNFTAPHLPEYGGLFTAHEAFRKVGNGKIVDVVGRQDFGKTYSDLQLRVGGFGIKNNYGIPFPLSYAKNYDEIYRMGRDEQVSLIVIHSLFSDQAVYGYKIAKHLGIPYLFVPHGVLDPYIFSYNKIRKNTWMKIFGNKIIAGASSVICATSNEAEKAAPFLKESKIDICEWGIQIPDKITRDLWRQEMRRALKIAEKDKVLLFLGRMNSMKRPVEIAKRFVGAQNKGWTLLMVGYFESLKIVDELRLLSAAFPNIILHDAITGLKKWKLFAASDAFIHLSERENFGYSVVEAAAMSLPLVLSKGVDVYPYFASGSAFVSQDYQPKNEIFTVEKMLNSSKEKLISMGEKSSIVVKENFTLQKFNTQLTNIFLKYSKKIREEV